VKEDQIRYGDGSPGLYSYIDKPDFAVVIAEEDDGFWLVEQYRYPIARRQWEFPQGGWPAGVGGTREELAIAELREETGITAGRWQHLGHLWASYGYSNQGYDIYLASELSHGEPERETTEQDMRHAWFAGSDVRRMLVQGSLADSHTVAAWGLLELHRSRSADGSTG
jgi:8-oxo-dGTP pyrophosphatase MutT (NUDIX family)